MAGAFHNALPVGPHVNTCVRGFSDDPPMDDAAAYQAEMNRRMAVRLLMRTVLKALVERVTSHEVRTWTPLLLLTHEKLVARC